MQSVQFLQREGRGLACDEPLVELLQPLPAATCSHSQGRFLPTSMGKPQQSVSNDGALLADEPDGVTRSLPP
ncbi:hypothetical protein ACGFWD_37535 [Streptomyces sp. NPDC048448]|uniref:hypothetical protein n=1 Tax=Streptomyces sp. NPDC048448 TaxID=3365554 RepID=UPI00371A5BEF